MISFRKEEVEGREGVEGEVVVVVVEVQVVFCESSAQEGDFEAVTSFSTFERARFVALFSSCCYFLSTS